MHHAAHSTPLTAYGKAVAARQEFGQLVSQSIQRSRQHTAASATVSVSPSSAPAFDCAMSDVVAAAAAAAATGTALPDSLLVDNAGAAAPRDQRRRTQWWRHRRGHGGAKAGAAGRAGALLGYSWGCGIGRRWPALAASMGWLGRPHTGMRTCHATGVRGV